MFKKFFLLLSISIGLAVGAAQVQAQAQAQKLEVATFAGGCFWCIESDFDNVPGVVKTISGYTGGQGANPTYKTYIAKGHIEALQITFDTNKTSYKKLLDVFWHSVDPTDAGGQFCDRGHGYITGIFARNKSQAAIAKASKAALIKANPDKKIVTNIFTAGPFFNAESYHQGYGARNPIRYNYYRRGCGRDARVRELWGKQAHRGINKH